ncbi:MAG: hypothetical protein AAFQ07_11440, partial [Chloroflexota bacterium]
MLANNDRWEDGSSNAIDHGANNDQNIITETQYDGDGRVQQTRNVDGRFISYTGYDETGRQAISVQNFVDQGTTTPADWVWDTADG